MGIVRHYRVGYLLILLTPVFSYIIFLFLLGLASLEAALDYLLFSFAFIGWHVSIIVLLTIGIALYLSGYFKREATKAEAKKSLLLGFILIMWGAFTFFAAAFILADLIDRSMNPGVGALTTWDYLKYWVWELKAIFWVGTGFLLIITSLVQIRHQGTKHSERGY